VIRPNQNSLYQITDTVQGVLQSILSGAAGAQPPGLGAQKRERSALGDGQKKAALKRMRQSLWI